MSAYAAQHNNDGLRIPKELVLGSFNHEEESQLVSEAYELVAASHWRMGLTGSCLRKWRSRPTVVLRYARYTRLDAVSSEMRSLRLLHLCLRKWSRRRSALLSHRALLEVAMERYRRSHLRRHFAGWRVTTAALTRRRQHREAVAHSSTSSDSGRGSPLMQLHTRCLSTFARGKFRRWQLFTARRLCVNYLTTKSTRALATRYGVAWRCYAQRRRLRRAVHQWCLLKLTTATHHCYVAQVMATWAMVTARRLLEKYRYRELVVRQFMEVSNIQRAAQCWVRWRADTIARRSLRRRSWYRMLDAFKMSQLVKRAHTHVTRKLLGTSWRAWREVHLTERAKRALLVVSSTTLGQVAAAGGGYLPAVASLSTVGIPAPAPPCPIGIASDGSVTRASSAPRSASSSPPQPHTATDGTKEGTSHHRDRHQTMSNASHSPYHFASPRPLPADPYSYDAKNWTLLAGRPYGDRAAPICPVRRIGLRTPQQHHADPNAPLPSDPAISVPSPPQSAPVRVAENPRRSVDSQTTATAPVVAAAPPENQPHAVEVLSELLGTFDALLEAYEALQTFAAEDTRLLQSVLGEPSTSAADAGSCGLLAAAVARERTRSRIRQRLHRTRHLLVSLEHSTKKEPIVPYT